MGRDRAAPASLSERRFFVPADAALQAGEVLSLGGEAAKHARVCRLEMGDPVELFDGAGRRAPARVESLAPRRLELRVSASFERVPRGPELVLVLCVPRAGKVDDIVRMTTELGVSALHFALSERSVGTGARADAKLERLMRVAREALRQSEGAYLPTLQPPSGLFEVAARAPADAQRGVLAARDGRPLSLAPRADRPVWLVVGPEGGLNAAEQSALVEAGFEPLSLGPSILRVQTAAVAATALALHQLRSAPRG